MPCECRTDARRLVVLAPGLEGYPELEALGGDPGWTLHRPLEALSVEVGGAAFWSGVSEVAAFLRALLDPARFDALKAAWAEPGKPLEAQVVKLIHAERLADMAPLDSSELAMLLRDARIETWYQPIFWSGTLEVWGYECLMRGRAGDGRLIGAPELLGWARQEHLVFLLDRTVREAHLTNAGSVTLPPGCHLLVNFLPTTIYRPEFCLATTVRAARASGLDFDRIVFEVVETDRVADREHLRHILDFYRREGFKVALDDVGSGYSGLALMGDLDPDLIKIDRELVQKSVTSPFHREICASLVKLGQDAGELVLAEGVETEAEWRTMEALGVNLFQGYLFSPPAPLPVTEALVGRPVREPAPV